MNPNLSKNQVSMINSILDRELDFLASNSVTNTTGYEKENFEIQKPRGLTSKDFAQSAGSGTSEKLFDSSFKEPRDITNQTNFKKNRTEIPEPPNPSSKMQNDLLDLQSKILTLEKTFGSLNASSSPQYNKMQNVPSQKTFETYTNKPLKYDLDDSVDDSPLKKKNPAKSPSKYTSGKLGDSLRDSTLFKGDSSRSNSPEKRTNQHRRRSLSQDTQRKLDTNAIEQSIREAQNQLDQTKQSLRKRSSSRGRTGSATKSRSASKKKREGSPTIESENYQEVIILNKKIMELKKRRDEEKSILLSERAKNQEMMVQIDKLNAKMKKMQIDLEKFAKIDIDYQRLMESFEKSEYIRNQQKQLITSLQQEIEQLKQQNENSQLRASDLDETKKKKTSTSKGKTTTSKKKVIM